MNVQSDQTLRMERTFSESPEEVFDAWTTPEVLERWWAAGDDWQGLPAEVDLRPGGRLRLRMRNPEGQEFAGGGEYREVDRPRRLVYTWTWEDMPDSPNADSLVTVEFHGEDGGATRVVLTHEGLASEESRANHESGWTACFDNLERRAL